MKLEKFKRIIKQYLEGELSKEKKDNVDRWFDKVANEGESPFVDVNHRKRIYDELLAAMPIVQSEIPKPRIRVLWKRITVAAAVLFFLSFGLLYFSKGTFSIFGISKNSATTLTEIVTAIGEIRTIHLPDSSVISLHGNTKIAFAATNFHENRKIILRQGEVFFDVKRDSLHPFSIAAGDVAVKVLGTSFNVNYATKANHITVDVKTGRVAVNSGLSNDAFVLTPGQGLVYDTQQHLFERIDTDAAHSNLWMTGGVILNGSSFKDLQELIFNRYGLKLRTENLKTDGFSYSLFIPKVESVDQIMQMIGSIHQLKYRRTADAIVLYK